MLSLEVAYAMTPIADIEDIITGGPQAIEELGNTIDALVTALHNDADQMRQRQENAANAADTAPGRERNALDDAIDRRNGQ